MYEPDVDPVSADAAPPIAAVVPTRRFGRFALPIGSADWTMELVEECSADPDAVALSFGQRVGARVVSFVTLRSPEESYTGDEFALGETLFGYTFRAELGAEGTPEAALAWARISVIGPRTETKRELSCRVSARVTLAVAPLPGSLRRHAPRRLWLPGSLTMQVREQERYR